MLVEQLGRCMSHRLPYTSLARISFAFRTPRARWNSTAAAPDGPAVSETNRAEATMKRFWDTVGVEKRGDALTVTLDKRALKTPSGNTLLLPGNKLLVASLIAAEWDHQATLLKPHALPMTSIASRAFDDLGEQTTRYEVQEALLKYLDTDTICFHQDYPPQLERLQTEHWDPLLEWARKTFDVKLFKSESILFATQPEATHEKFRKVLAEFDQWQMAAMERTTYTTKSFVIALALVLKHLTVEQAALAATVEVASQIERWGEVEDTHDVDYHDVRRQLGSAACLLSEA
ncbi:ATP synthase mitochondrial F1 complex assembly factor 2 [Hypsizygus marmoreus]|uniref:ATP synthase mitochondrial F1 complex assembly factor 2 n=1 Tax=Hypsizygus marmoreus TaxID=39966 RepID=A0A369JPF3_HYPMA|nr:ATP synthase mitochondrial F1 complex assembly factor 2 [Hypsizygus marmoreus]